MALDTTTEVEKISNVEDAGGNTDSPANLTQQKNIRDAVQALDDALDSNAGDELRVVSPSALDVSAAEVDVDLNTLSYGTLEVEQQTPVGIEDSLGTQIDPLGAGDQPLDVSAAEVEVDLNSLSYGTVEVEQQTPVQLENSSGTNIDPATEGTVGNIDTLLDAIDDALASVGTDEIRVSSPNPLDVSSAEVDVDLNALSYGTLEVEQQTPVQLENSSGTNIDPLSSGDQPLDVSSSEVDVDLNSLSYGTLEVEQQTPVQVEDDQGTTVDPRSQPNSAGLVGDTITPSASGATFGTQSVPDGFSAVIQNAPANSDNVQIQDDNGNDRVVLEPGQSVSLGVDNLDAITVTGTSNNPTIHALVEAP